MLIQRYFIGIEKKKGAIKKTHTKWNQPGRIHKESDEQECVHPNDGRCSQ